MGVTESPLQAASEKVREINDGLAETDGSICTMEFTGPVGYHHYIATGITDPEYLWKVALLQALDDTVFEMMYTDAESPADARSEIERQLEDWVDPFRAELIGDEFEENLRDLQESMAALDEEVES